MIVEHEFIAGVGVRVWAHIYDGIALYDPDSITIDIYDPTPEKQVDAQAMTQSETGIYYYVFDTSDADTGWWLARVTATEGGEPSGGTTAFEVN